MYAGLFLRTFTPGIKIYGWRAFFTDFMPHPYGGFSGVAVRGLYRCFWAIGVLRFFYGFLRLFMVDFA